MSAACRVGSSQFLQQPVTLGALLFPEGLGSRGPEQLQGWPEAASPE